MNRVEAQLQQSWAYFMSGDFDDADAGVAVTDALAAAGLLAADRAAAWRMRFERTRPDARRPQPDLALRERCRAYADERGSACVARHLADLGLIDRADFERVNAAEYDLDYDEDDARREPPRLFGVRAGLDEADGLTVVWVARFEEDLRLFWRDTAPVPVRLDDLELRDAAGGVHRPAGGWSTSRSGEAVFLPAPPGERLELRFREQALELAVP